MGSVGCWLVFATLGEPVGDVFDLGLGSEVSGEGYVVGVVRIVVPGIAVDGVVWKPPGFTHGEVRVENQEHKEVERPAIEIVDYAGSGVCFWDCGCA